MKNRITRFLLLLGFAIILATAWLKPLEGAATEKIDAGFKRALVSFATARTLNAIISVAEGTEVSVEPGGVGVNFTVGQALRPVNDVVAQFAELMLAASVAFGVMKILVSISSFWVVSLVLSAFALGWGWYQWQGRRCPLALTRILFILLLVRFAVPLVTVGSDALFQAFLNNDYVTSQKAIEGDAGQLAKLSTPVEKPKADAGIGDRIKEFWSQNINVGSRIEQLKAVATQVVEHIIQLIIVFLMQTLVMPLLLFWALYRVGKAILELSVASSARVSS